MPLAHPLLEPRGLPLPPLVIGVIAAALVAAVGRWWPVRPAGPDRRPDEVWSWAGRLTGPQIAGRVLGVVLLLAAIVAGRVGSTDQLENLAPALVVGVAWPALLFASAAGGPVWRWLDPWDGMARVVASVSDEGPGDVRPAVAVAVAWTWYLGVYPDPLSPRAVGLALAVYSIITLGGCILVGRTRWLARVELFGLLLGSLALLPRGALAGWRAPRGMAAVLGGLAGGLLFGAIRTTELWGGLNAVPGATLYATLGLIGSCAAGAAILTWLDTPVRPMAVAALPAVAGIAVALGMARSRLFTSLQLLPGLLGDPLGTSPAPPGSLAQRVEVPLAPTRLAAVQLTVVILGCAVGAMVGAQRGERLRGEVAAAILAAAGTTAVALAPGL
ncbi:MAG TPA: hypothetical protein VHH92_00785 [Actinomycetota bacterium]|nr:hypothetical protein [Actinomycetota bacterium]